MNDNPIPRVGAFLTLGFDAAVFVAGLGVALLAALIGGGSLAAVCSARGGGGALSVTLGPPGMRRTVGASEYGGPDDPSSGTVGASGANLLTAPDSYAELGGDSFQTAVALGGLPYGAPLRITWDRHSAIAYKRDIGLGGGPVDGYPRVIDLWWRFALSLGIPYEHGQWSGPVGIERTPATGASDLLGDAGAATLQTVSGAPANGAGEDVCAPEAQAPLTLTPGARASLLPDGRAAAPAGAPAAVRAMVAAGNQLVGEPYLYGGGHGLPLNERSLPPTTARAASTTSSTGRDLMRRRRRRDVHRSRVVRRAGTWSVGHDLRQRRPCVHVRCRAAVGHTQRRRSAGRELRDRMAPARPER